MTEIDVVAEFERLPSLVNGNELLVARGRFLSTRFLVGAGGLSVYVTVRCGQIEEVTSSPALMRSWSFAIRASADAWSRFWAPMPRPGYHDLLAMTRFGRATIEGELQPLMANLRYLKEVLESPRRRRRETGHDT